jgi:ferredoxin
LTNGGYASDRPPPVRDGAAPEPSIPDPSPWMTYIVTDPCIKCKFMDCVEVCPVDCFYEGENFLAINPDECIDCGVCEPECPVDAIKPDTEDDPDGKWLRINTEYSKVWPNITLKGTPPADAEQYERETEKLEKYFSEKPGQGS